ncbi:protocatechuate 3,4-dioxygenase [Bradyrhizobium sp. 147]|jgi:protocatechuate 3,4-dioxygenase beta subunit|uniref:protocatechuate 3,4-dioxygenase n=1 Tax=unclassified Bradyrhizobium TaxID=2631580 RepID=UPI001FF9D6A4|nr:MULTISPECIES: protocatechuate 3,4-dioxygenase [unclassified Bradyrhizobium]MCK1545529.1 protocatechuate 3,4-dioxygenase [Bradyrhizobium sp. 179]MCK1623606.1 protocatechuate 3,4-dioxygenase [Bradyrhizobium sp. 160]MCK1681361.1 protocatechuate 3,4-dioxygenase [Bradyrhizobium sp. 147]
MTTPPDLPANRIARHRTPDQILGPYFPLGRRHVERCDLTAIEGANGIAQGEIIEVAGRILNREGEPVSGASVTIWQANTFGRYTHPDDTNPAPLDPNFVGNADVRSGADGSYRIKTVKPGAYPAGPDWKRPPHIHFEVHGQFERLITQMYFPDELLNASDRLLNAALRPDLLIASVSSQDQSRHRVFRFDIVLSRG